MAIEQQPKEFEEKVIAIDRVARVVKGGRRFRFRATVEVGDGKGRVGVGAGKGSEVMTSIAKAVSRAKSQMITVPLKGHTIPHEIQVKFAGAHVLLKPASAGTGVIAGGAVRNVVEVAGIHVEQVVQLAQPVRLGYPSGAHHRQEHMLVIVGNAGSIRCQIGAGDISDRGPGALPGRAQAASPGRG